MISLNSHMAKHNARKESKGSKRNLNEFLHVITYKTTITIGRMKSIFIIHAHIIIAQEKNLSGKINLLNYITALCTK